MVANVGKQQKHYPKVKFCGMTREEDILYAVELGVNAIGMIMVPGSSRVVDLARAKALRALIPPKVTAVVVVRNSNAADIVEILKEVKPDIIQFHGDETSVFCEQFKHPYWKAIGVRDEIVTKQLSQTFSQANGLVFDSWSAEGCGGHGIGFDWTLIPRIRRIDQQMFILAGGLRPDNINLTRSLLEQGVVNMLDLSSGIEANGEKQVKGVKSAAAMQAFMVEFKAMLSTQ